MKSLIVFSCLLLFSVALKNPEWQSFKTEFSRKYKSLIEEDFRRKIFLNNKMIIDRHNRLFDEGNATFTMRINQFSDMSSEEYIERMSGFVMSPYDPSTPVHKNTRAAPFAVDWRKKKCVTRVKQQGQCGSCWAFSAAGSVESIQCIKTGKLVEVSEQELVDCAAAEGASGCDGGWMTEAFRYIINRNGISKESAYPYTAMTGTCQRPLDQKGASIRSYVNVAEGREYDLRNAVAQQPVSVAVDASLPSFQQYDKGIYYDRDCSRTAATHAMLVVGYGTQRGRNYWIVKNSWGTGWGEKGYIRMARNRNNNCGIATRASYPVY